MSPGILEALPPGGRRGEELVDTLRPAWVTVDLDALERNLGRLRRRVGDRSILAVVKADAYGHGAPAVGLALEAAGVDWLGVALVEEGVELRKAGVKLPILVLGVLQPPQYPLVRRYGLTPTLSSLEQIASWRSWLREGGKDRLSFHLKVDTGMSRLGVAIEELPEALSAIRADLRLELSGLLSHFAEAERPEAEPNRRQRDRFAAVLEQLPADEREGIVVHMANSAAALHQEASRHDLVRLGLSLFGLDPAGRDSELEPVMSVSARIVSLREVPAGTRLSYGGRRVTERPSRIAVVPVGYADGYTWRLSNRAEALLHGRRIPVAGSVTMDMTLLDVTDVPAALGDEVHLLGEEGDERIDAAELARLADTLPYELLCHLGLRLPRRYRKAGRETLVTRFLGRPA